MEVLIRRSNLIMPVNRPEFVEKSWQRGADSITLDLEDSVPDEGKERARSMVKQAIAIAGRGGSDVLVRVNNHPDHLIKDLKASIYEGLWGVTIPKIETPDQLCEIENAITSIESMRNLEPGSIRLMLLFESAKGLINLERILAVATRVRSVALGTEDFARDVGMQLIHPSMMEYPKLRVLFAAKAYRLHSNGVMGTLSDFKDLDAFYKTAREAYQYGFDGSSCIHPAQVPILNKAFAPSDEEIAHAKAIIEVYNEAKAAGRGSAKLDGKMVDLPIAERALKILDKSEAINKWEAKKRSCIESASQ